MNTFMVVMRTIHILSGVFWAGTLMFFAWMLEPAIRAVGPDGGRVMKALQERHYLTIMPIIAILTVVSGLVMFWYLSGRLDPGWMGTSYGMSLSMGGAVSIVAAVIGLGVMRPAALRVGRLGAALQQTSDDGERERIQGEMQSLRLRARTSARWVAAMLAVAVVTMAVARYL